MNKSKLKEITANLNSTFFYSSKTTIFKKVIIAEVQEEIITKCAVISLPTVCEEQIRMNVNLVLLPRTCFILLNGLHRGCHPYAQWNEPEAHFQTRER